MGLLTSSADHTGLLVGKVMLGVPVPRTAGHDSGPDEVPDEFVWAHPLLPNGVIDADGNVTVTDPTES